MYEVLNEHGVLLDDATYQTRHDVLIVAPLNWMELSIYVQQFRCHTIERSDDSAAMDLRTSATIPPGCNEAVGFIGGLQLSTWVNAVPAHSQATSCRDHSIGAATSCSN